MLQCQARVPDVQHLRIASALGAYRPGWMPGEKQVLDRDSGLRGLARSIGEIRWLSQAVAHTVQPE